MRKFWFLISGLFMVLFFVVCTTPAVAAEKTGFVDMREVIMKSDAGKRASGELKILYEKDRSQIKSKEAELEKLKGELEKQRTILTEASRKEKEAAYQKKLRDYQLLVKDSNEEIQVKDQEISKTLIPEVLRVINAIGERDKYTLIIDVSTIPVAYHAKENDLTKRVTQELNKTYKPKK